MAMKFKQGATPEVVISTLSAVDKRMTTDATAEFNKAAEQIVTMARQFAPVDQGDLEAAIKVTPAESGGRNSVKRTVYIDSLGKTRDDVESYAPLMHEGSYKLGPKSQAKAAALGVIVGPKFLTRAAAKIFPIMTKAISAAIKRNVS